MVTCKTCGSGHPAIFEDTEQGTGCSATLFHRESEHFVVGHYGSLKHDGRLYKLKTGEYTLGTICDDCIDVLVNTDQAIAMRADAYWGV